MDPMRLNPVEKYLIEKLQEDFSKANNIEAIYGELDLYTHKVYDISKWLMSFIRRKAYPEVGVDYVVDASDQAIIDSVYDCLSRICNSKDKLLSKDISTGTLSHIKRSHLMANDSKVIFYREAGDKHSFIITCKGISYVYRNRMVECTWEKLLGVYYDDKDSMFYFYDHFNEEPIIKIERYDLLKWDSDYLAVVVCINAICNVFEDTAPQLIEQYGRLEFKTYRLDYTLDDGTIVRISKNRNNVVVESFHEEEFIRYSINLRDGETIYQETINDLEIEKIMCSLQELINNNIIIAKKLDSYFSLVYQEI